ncbi:helix-turn-helix domain-containing protein [Geodermatophilus sp. CPCC 205506]|uniref:AraC-like ligand-binding domain-containing protein n=1 Tax=Geodermatophilus sp. CPCC 205506 TaxID=2936596 RepID=UPI003EEDF8F1
MPVWDSTPLPERDQFDYWNDVICRAFVPLRAVRRTDRPGFAARVETRPLVEVNRARIVSQPQETLHGVREVADTDAAYYFVNLQLAGRCAVRQGGRESVVGPGQFTVVDTTEPYSFDLDGVWHMVSYRVPHAHLSSRLGGRRPSTAVAVGGAGAGGVVTALMHALWQVGDEVDRTGTRDLEQSFVSAVAAATAAGVEPGRFDRGAVRAAVLQHVRDHLGDRTLSVTTVCRRFAISPRTLHNLFADAEDSFGATVRAMRLDRCALVLAAAAPTVTVTEIATAHGFDDPSSFSRAFRRRFGVSPREARQGAACTNGTVGVR